MTVLVVALHTLQKEGFFHLVLTSSSNPLALATWHRKGKRGLISLIAKLSTAVAWILSWRVMRLRDCGEFLLDSGLTTGKTIPVPIA